MDAASLIEALAAAAPTAVEEWNEAVAQRMQKIATAEAFSVNGKRLRCSICDRHLSQVERVLNVEERPTGMGFKVQKWSYCDEHFKQVAKEKKFHFTEVNTFRREYEREKRPNSSVGRATRS